MIKYIVEEDTEKKNYGIYDLLTKGPGLKNLGAIGEDEYYFEVGVKEHNQQVQKMKEKLGSFNIMINLASEDNCIKVFINYVDDYNHNPLTLFQYKTIVGILKECRMYNTFFEKPIKINLTSELFLNKKLDRLVICPYNKNIAYEYEKEYYNLAELDETIEEIEKEIDVLFPHREVKENVKVLKLFPLFKRKNKQ